MRSVQGALRGAVVVICCDGLEQGDPSDLGHQMYLLRRSCHEIIWVNPLAGSERYQPKAGGMRASLPSIDRLMAGDTVAALEGVGAGARDPALGWSPTGGCGARSMAVSSRSKPSPRVVTRRTTPSDAVHVTGRHEPCAR